MKRFLCVLFMGLVIFSAAAQQKDAAPASAPAKEQQWDFLSITFVPGVPRTADVFNVYGVKIGIPIGFGSGSFVAGVEGSLFVSMSDEVYGVQAAPLFNNGKKIEGLQASTLVNIADNVSGLQFGIVNVAKEKSFQIGLLNFIKDSCVPCFPFVNFRF